MKNDPIDEQISAWLDDELPPAEMELFVSRLTRSAEYRETAARYALAGALMREENVPAANGHDLRERVQRALEIEAGGQGEAWIAPAAALPAAASAGTAAVAGRRAWRNMAAAAALGAVAVGVGLNLRESAPPGDVQGAGTIASSTLSRPAVSNVAEFPPADPSRRTDRLTSYLVYHGEYSSPISTKVLDSHIVNQRPYVVTVSTVERMRHD